MIRIVWPEGPELDLRTASRDDLVREVMHLREENAALYKRAYLTIPIPRFLRSKVASRSGEQPPVPATPGNREGTGGNHDPFAGVAIDPRGPEIPLSPEVLRVLREDGSAGSGRDTNEGGG